MNPASQALIHLAPITSANNLYFLGNILLHVIHFLYRVRLEGDGPMPTMPIKIHLENLLTLLAFGFDMIARPRLRNLDSTYESWLYDNGLLERARYLERAGYLDRKKKRNQWFLGLTEKAHLKIHGGRDPEKSWRRHWDGWWRQIVFDLPLDQHRHRSSLIRWLRHNGFGYLQDSVWIKPDPVHEIAETLKEYQTEAGSVVVLESRCAPGFANSSLVSAAWPFEKINEAYRDYQKFLANLDRKIGRRLLPPSEIFPWLETERRHWTAAFELDPLLPLCLWPDGYEGQRAWRARREALRKMTALCSKT